MNAKYGGIDSIDRSQRLNYHEITLVNFQLTQSLKCLFSLINLALFSKGENVYMNIFKTAFSILNYL